MNENLCVPAGWRWTDAFYDARSALIRAIGGLKNAATILKVWEWIARRKTLRTAKEQWALPRQTLAEFSRTLDLTENQIRGALAWLVDHDWLDRTGQRDPVTGRWKRLRIWNARRQSVTNIPVLYRLGSAFLRFFPKAIFSFFRNQNVATLQNNTEACATGETTSSCKLAWVSPQVEEVDLGAVERQQAAENEAENTKVGKTIAASLAAVRAKTSAFFTPKHPDRARLGRVQTGQATKREVMEEAKAHGLDIKAIKAAGSNPTPYSRVHRAIIPDKLDQDYAPGTRPLDGKLDEIEAMVAKPRPDLEPPAPPEKIKPPQPKPPEPERGGDLVSKILARYGIPDRPPRPEGAT